jgi:glycosyltransferase involved in cell wall biosynthesis
MPRIDFVATNRKPALFRGDASFIYRCENLAMALRAAGHDAWMGHIAHYRPSDACAVMFHRPQLSPRFWRLARTLRHRGTRVIIDLDDLIFDPASARYSPAVVNGILPQRKVWLRFVRHRLALGSVDAVTCSTSALAERLHRLVPGLPVTIIPNAVHMRWRDHDGEPAPRSPGKTISYTPGTRSHDRDFQLIMPVLERFLESHPEVRLRITGELSHSLRARPGQVSQAPRVPFSDYARVVRGGWVNLSPLEPSPFNECKSAIKVIEAGYWNVPTICSPNPDIERFVDAGARIARRDDDWYRELERLLDGQVYAECTRGLRDHVLAIADARAQARKLLALAGADRG